MAKMYYTELEAAQKLSVSPAQLAGLVREGKLRVYADGPNRMYKVGEVDGMTGLNAESDIRLSPADSSGTHDVIGLADTGLDGIGKSGSVITSEGVSIFDEDDLEIETADPMAKTQISPSLEDQIGLESVGSGSGLLDLTRESDDTSLGAEVLDHIDVESDVSADTVAESVSALESSEPAPMMAPVMEDRIDPTAGAFVGLAAVATVLMVLAAAVALAVMTGSTPGYVSLLGRNLGIVAVAAIVAAGIAAGVGFFLSKQNAQRIAAARQM